ncbi:MAG: diguanylate cyclase [Holophagaceae bacterium]|nr:diguanylate cyclase [Holophagaceae bacterium]
MKSVKKTLKNKILISTITVFVISVFFISINNYRLLNTSVITKTNSILSIFINDISIAMDHLDIIFNTAEKVLNEKHLAISRMVAQMLDRPGADLSKRALESLCTAYGIEELCVANAKGTITHSNITDYLGFNYGSTEPTRKYLALAGGTVSELQEGLRKSEVAVPLIGDLSHYTGIARKGGGFYQIGFHAGVVLGLRDDINIKKIISDTKLGRNGFGMVLHDGIISAHPDELLLGRDVSTEEWCRNINRGDGYAWINIDGIKYYAGYKNKNSYTIIALIPGTDYNKELKWTFIVTILLALASLIMMIVIIYIIMNKLFKRVKKVIDALEAIAKGNFDTRVEGDYDDELGLIKNAVNDMAENIVYRIKAEIQTERRVREVEFTMIDLLDKVNFDALTNIYNRRYLDETLERVVKLLSVEEKLLSVLVIDIDFFKLYNDTYGHTEGDKCLKAIAKILSSNIRKTDDFVARYGGEEFVVVLPFTEERSAQAVADKMLKNVNALNIKHETSKIADHVTISIGITTGKVMGTQSSEDYIKRADEALYLSKENGRNRYTFLPKDPSV